MAISLEVAEHLPEDCADQFVGALVRAAPIVVFSAAIPHQGGVDHRNEQRQSYWREKFEEHAYVAVDCIRPLVYRHSEVKVWYRQNTIVYCEPTLCPSGYVPIRTDYETDRIDPELMTMMREILIWQPQSGCVALKNLKNAILQRLGKVITRK